MDGNALIIPRGGHHEEIVRKNPSRDLCELDSVYHYRRPDPCLFRLLKNWGQTLN